MKQLLLGGISIGLHLYFFLAFGSLLLKVLKKEERFSWCLVPVLGLFVYYGFFEILAFPMTLLLVPLHVLTVVWGAALAAVGIAAAFFCGRTWGRQLKNLGRLIKTHRGLFLFLVLLTGIQVVYVAVYHLNSADAAFYVGNVSTSLYTDTLGRYNPYTGNSYSTFNVRYVTAAYYLENAVVCQLLKIHPMVLTKTAAPMLILFLVNLLYYHLGMELFHGERKKAAVMDLGLLIFGIMVGSPEFGAFLYYRTFEGKAMLQGLVIPFLFLIFLWLYKKTKDRLAWWSLFFTALGSVCLSTSAMTLVPGAVCAGVLAVMILRRTIKPMFWAAICILPDILVAALYVAANLHLVTLYAK